MLAELFAVMAPVLAGAGLGFTWVRLGHPYPVEFVTRLVFNIGTPALIIASLSSAEIDAGSVGRTMLAAALVMIAMAAATPLMARLLGRDWRVILAPMMYPNTGNMGLPDRKSTRLNSSHVRNSYAVFCLKKKISYYVDQVIWNNNHFAYSFVSRVVSHCS